MNREEKNNMIEELKEKISSSEHLYITDSSALTVTAVNDLRRKCFENDIEMKVAKNTLMIKAMEALEDDYEVLYEHLTGPTAVMFTKTANGPAKVIKEFRESHDKPVLKVAFIDKEVFAGDEQVQFLAALKSKEELVGEIISLLQSPIKNVISALQSGGNKLSGILKILSERSE